MVCEPTSCRYQHKETVHGHEEEEQEQSKDPEDDEEGEGARRYDRQAAATVGVVAAIRPRTLMTSSADSTTELDSTYVDRIRGRDKRAELTVGVTGHRPDKLGGWDPLHPVVERVKKGLRVALIETWPAYLVTGMALGVDQWAAQEAVELGIPFIAALPCDDMESQWPLPSQERFRALLAKARQVVVVSAGPYKPWKMQRRNEWVVDNCGLLLSVHDGSTGGTYNCLRYAAEVGRDVRVIKF